MKTLPLLFLGLFSTNAFADVCSNSRWVQEHCPQCQTTSDGKFLLPFQGNFIKFDVNAYGEELNSMRVDLLWEGVSNERGVLLSRELTMNNENEREKASADYQQLCGFFNEYGYYSSGIVFSQGNHFSGPGEPSRGRINQTCSKSKPNWLNQGLNYLASMGSSTLSDTCTATRINTAAREIMRTPVTLQGNVRENSGNRR